MHTLDDMPRVPASHIPANAAQDTELNACQRALLTLLKFNARARERGESTDNGNAIVALRARIVEIDRTAALYYGY